MHDEFIRILKEHTARYPKMEKQDYGKLVFQSEYGPEHLVTEKESVLSFLQEEMAELPSDAAPPNIEPIGGGLCRFPLSFCKSGTDLETLAELFLLTAQEYSRVSEGILDKIDKLQKLSVPGMEEWLQQWKEKGYPPVHHSQSYRDAYHPHYRLLKREYAGYFPAIAAVKKYILSRGSNWMRSFGTAAEDVEKEKPVIIGIDGRCGSGKTGLASLFSKLFDCNVFHMDDFYLPLERRLENWKEIPGGNIDDRRLTDEILKPVQRRETVFYQPYDCGEGKIGKPSQMRPKLLNILEGSYSGHPFFRENYQFTIFLTCSKEEQKRRLQRREGGYFSVFEEQWIPFEEQYRRCYDVEKRSDLCLDTSEFFDS